MNCFVCDMGTLNGRQADVEGEVKGEKFVVRTAALVCDNCGHVAMEGAETAEFMRRLADGYRRAHGLLTSEEIRHIRVANALRYNRDAFGDDQACTRTLCIVFDHESRRNVLWCATQASKRSHNNPARKVDLADLDGV